MVWGHPGSLHDVTIKSLVGCRNSPSHMVMTPQIPFYRTCCARVCQVEYPQAAAEAGEAPTILRLQSLAYRFHGGAIDAWRSAGETPLL